MKKTEPVYTKEITEDGWILRADHGKQGVSVAQVHVAPGTPEDAARNRERLNKFLKRFGYKLLEDT